MITLTKPDNFDLFKSYCKANSKWGVYVSLPWDEDYNILTLEEKYVSIEFSLPLWSKYWDNLWEVISDAIINGYVIFLCDTEEELEELYSQIRGDDGLPNDTSPGECYACTCSPEGILLKENT